MARVVEIGIVVKASAPEPKKVESSLKKVRDSLKRTEEQAKKSFEGFGAAVVVANQGLELFKKGFELTKKVFEETVAVSVELRSENDKLRKEFEDLDKETKNVQASIGDILLPTLLAATQAFDRATGGAGDFLQKNREILSAKVAETFVSIGKALTTGVAAGFLAVSRTVTFVRVAFHAVLGAINEVVAKQIEAVAVFIEGNAQIAEAFGADGLAGKAREAGRAVAELGAEFSSSGDEGQREIDELIRQQTVLESGVDRTVKAIEKGLGEIVPAAARKAAEAIIRVNADQEKANAELLKRLEEGAKLDEEIGKRQADARQANLDAELAAIDFLAQKKEEEFARAVARDKEQTDLEEAQQAKIAAGAEGLAKSSIGFIKGFAAAAEEGTKAVAGFFKNLAIKILESLALVALSAAFKALFTFLAPGVGGAAGTVFSFIGGIFGAQKGGLVPGFQDGGGFVPGVGRGDKVPALLEPGELVIPRDNVADGNFGGGTTVVQNFTNQTLGFPTSSQNEKYLRDVVRPANARLDFLGFGDV